MPNSPQPVGREKTHPLAQRLFELLRDRSDDDRRLVFGVLAERLGQGVPEDKGHAIEALEACRADTGGQLPSVERYERWRAGGAGRTAPSVGRLRTLFGSWSDALAAMPSVPAADPTTTRLLSRGRRVSREQALAALRAFGSSLSAGAVPTQTRYAAWAATQVAVDRRAPASQDTIKRIFGSWRRALVEAGLTPPERPVPAIRRRLRFSTEDAVEALRAFWRDSGPPVTCHRYQEWAMRQDDAGEVRPSYHTIERLFGGWKAAVHQVLGTGTRAGEQRAPAYAPEELWTVLRRCTEELGHVPRAAEWDVWRGTQPKPCPSIHTLAKYLGGGTWRGVMEVLEREGYAR